MFGGVWTLGLLAAASLALVGARAEAGAGQVDARRVARADAEPGSWLVHGRTPGEQRFSPLAGVDTGNVHQLGLAWAYETGTRRGLEATPIVVDGVLYATGPWSIVYALDAATGRELWRHDPEVPRWKGRDACCDVVNRGVAVWKGRVYVGTIDGRLVALDAVSGQPVWEVLTVDPAQPYTITGAPRVVKGRVVIGNGGAEFGVRGYVSAYDAESGERLWRFYTVPDNRHGPHEHAELALAAETWSEDALWESGLGGTVWDSMAYDPDLDLLYVGVGNSSVYNRRQRSPGGGDNLFLASILALRPDTGRLVWHYQTTPGEHWDYTATQHIVLADLDIRGRRRKVLLQAPKNGFFYVIDRETGELLSAEKYVHASWASHVDPSTGRPVERPEAVWEERGAVVAPAIFGGHNWHPMSFHPGTGMVYIPVNDNIHFYEPDPDFRYTPGRFNTAENYAAVSALIEGFEALRLAPCKRSRLVAWDPVRQHRIWEVVHDTGVPGGVLSTAGGLVFQGSGTGIFAAYDALDGRTLWSSRVGVGIMAPPVTYRVGGEQYVAVLAGLGGSQGGHLARFRVENDGRILAWKLGGKAPMPSVRERPPGRVEAPQLEATAETLSHGRNLYSDHCMRCHGMGAVGSGLYPDLRFASRDVHASWSDIVLGGTRAGGGMASFADQLKPSDALAIQAYVAERAHHEPDLLERAVGWAATRICIPTRWATD